MTKPDRKKAKMPDIDGEVVKKAKVIANTFYLTHDQTYLDREDFVQVALLGYLEGRPMEYAVIDAYRDAAPLKIQQFRSGDIPVPKFSTLLDTQGYEMDFETITLLSLLRDEIQKEDPITLAIMLRHYFYGETMVHLCKELDISEGKAYKKRKACIKRLQDKYLERRDSC